MRLFPDLADIPIISGSTEDRVLHEQEIPVQLVFPNRERETRTTALIIKVKSHTDPGQKATSFRIELLDEQNPLFLYTVSIGENEFLELKTDQNLIIDYSQFHVHFIDILQRVKGPSSRFEARLKLVLTKNPQEFAEFAIHETSEFRRLDQIKLKAVQATDATLKDHLSLNIKSLKTQCSVLQNDNNGLQRALSQKESELLTLQKEYNSSLKTFEAQKNSMTIEFSEKLSSSKEEAAKVQRKAEVQFDEEKRRLELDYKRQLSDISSKFESVQNQNQELSQANFNLSHSVESLQSSLKTKTKELDQSVSEESRLKSLKESLDSQVLSLEKDLGRVSSRVAFLEQQLTDKEALCQKVQSLLDASNEQKTHLEQSFKLLKDAAQKDERRLNECIKEIKKGNQIIQNLQNELKAARSKQKMTGTVIVKQETILEKNKKEIECLGDTILELRATSQKFQSDLQEKESKISALKKEIEKSKEMITQYQSMLGKYSEQTIPDKDTSRVSSILPTRQGIYQSAMLSAPSIPKSFDGLNHFSPAAAKLQSRLEYTPSHHFNKTPIRSSSSYTANAATSAFFPSAVPASTPR